MNKELKYSGIKFLDRPVPLYQYNCGPGIPLANGQGDPSYPVWVVYPPSNNNGTDFAYCNLRVFYTLVPCTVLVHRLVWMPTV